MSCKGLKGKEFQDCRQAVRQEARAARKNK